MEPPGTPTRPHRPSRTGAVLGMLALTAAGCNPAPPRPDSDSQSPLVRGTPELRSESVETTLIDGLRDGLLAAQCTGNGRDTVRIALRNLGREPLAVEIPPGTLFVSDSRRLVGVRPRTVTLGPWAAGETTVVTAALRAIPPATGGTYVPLDEAVTPLAVFLPYLSRKPEAALPAIQTAVLALTENLPLSAFARFALAAGPSPGTPPTDAFRVETRFIIEALQLLKEIGYPMDRLALMADPQLKIEAMIDPLAHAAAMRLYEICPEKEWEFWKHHLLEGQPATRHYALHGIARWFPATALRMLPKWALKSDLDEAYRKSAIHALAETRSEGAVSVLKYLRHELSSQPALSREVEGALRDLEENLRNPARFVPPVPYRASPPDLRDQALVPD